MNIVLPCKTIDDLNWKPICPEGEIVWEFDLGLNSPYFPTDDQLTFSALKLALSHFTKELWPLYAERTKGAILYRGSLDFASHFLWTEKQEENWQNWKKERPSAKEAHLFRLFAADAFSHYFQMLSHALPDELSLTLDFNTQGCGTIAETRQLLSKERFEHFHVLPEEPEAPLAICMPPESLCSGQILAKLDDFLSTITEPYRIIEESFLTELWGGVDRIYVLEEAVTSQGQRKIMGFRAAGGEIIGIRGRGI